jgi:hypothetical protein
MNDEIPTQMRAVVHALIKNEQRLRELGFTPNTYGEWSASNCRVTLYAVFGEWEIDIRLSNGSSVGCDVPIEKLVGRTAEEISRISRCS